MDKKFRLLPTSLTLFAASVLVGASLLWSASEKDGEKDTSKNPTPTVTVDHSPIPQTVGNEVASFADMLESATPSVVGVVTTEIVSGNRRGSMSPEDLYRRFFGIPPRDREDEPDDGDEEEDEYRVPTGMGSGVIIAPEGYILTNNHVVRNGRSDEIADEILVQLVDGREFTAEVVGTDKRTDIAVLKIDVDESLPALTMADTDVIRVGDICFAIGNPLRVGLTVTQGIVSGIGRTDTFILGFQGYEDFIQTDAAINMGNSGGALIDAKGRLIGINTAILSRTGGNIGIGFAIPSNLARYVMENLISKGKVPRGFLGVVPGDLNPDLAKAWGLPSTRGALIRSVEEGGAADGAGIKHRDVIIEVDGRSIDSARELRVAIAQTPPGQEVTLKLIRNGEEITKNVVLGNLGERLAEESGTTEETEEVAAFPDIELEELTDEIREEYSIPEKVTGVLIAGIDRVSPRTQDFREGMVISEVNRTPITTAEEISDNLKDGLNELYVWYRGSYDFMTYEK